MATGASEIDIIIIGGGITGAAAARDAAGRGLSVLLLERRDIGSGTTSRSSRMAHGGLRYLENAQFGLVRESLVERNRLFRASPDLVVPMRFRLPSGDPESRPPWMISIGLGIYDLFAGRRDSRREEDGFSYCDGMVRPERLAASLAYDAARRGAEIRTYAPVAAVEDEGRVVLDSGESFRGRAVLVCAGPWTDRVLENWGRPFDAPLLRPTRGTHLLVKGRIDEPRLLQATADGRVFFALPAAGGTLIGTTDLDDAGDPGLLRPREEEVAYLVAETERRLPTLDTTILGAWTGMRPLLRSGATPGARSRGEMIVVHPSCPWMVVVVGGKLTTMRPMAERAVSLVERAVLGREPSPWTANAAIPTCSEEWNVTTLADFMLRRTWTAFEGEGVDHAVAVRRLACALGWNESRLEREIDAYRIEASADFGLTIPAMPQCARP